MTCEATHSATSLPESAAGALPFGLPDGPMTDLFGQALAPASRSAPPATSVAAMMSATYGLRSSRSSASADLERSLASRLPALLDWPGGTMWRLTWKEKTTPLRRRVCQLSVSAPTISEKESFGWLPTPRASMGTHMIAWARAETGQHRSQLEDYLAWLYLVAGGLREKGLHVCPLLCATIMGYPTCWLDSAMRSFRKLPQPL